MNVRKEISKLFKDFKDRNERGDYIEVFICKFEELEEKVLRILDCDNAYLKSLMV